MAEERWYAYHEVTTVKRTVFVKADSAVEAEQIGEQMFADAVEAEYWESSPSYEVEPTTPREWGWGPEDERRWEEATASAKASMGGEQ